MADTFLTHSMIAERALFDLSNNLVMAKKVFKGYSTEFGTPIGGYKKGASVTIHLPNKFRAKTGAAIDKVDVEEPSTSISVDVQKHVAWDFTELDLTLKIADFSRKYINPATITLANVVDLDGMAEYVNIYNQVGTPGTAPATFGVLADAAERMDNEAVPQDERCAIWSPRAAWSLADGELKSLFHQNIVSTMVRRGFLGMFARTDHFMDQNAKAHTTGAFTTNATPVMNGTTAEKATSIEVDGWPNTTAVFKAGDVFTIAGVVGVNPVSGEAWENGQLRQFVVVSGGTSNGSGETTLVISPAIISSAANEEDLPYQTVVTLPANGAAITPVGVESSTYTQNLSFHPDCFALTMVPFRKPKSAGKSVMWGQASDKQLGLSITVATAFDIDSYSEATRLDILYGWDTVRAELGVRTTG